MVWKFNAIGQPLCLGGFPRQGFDGPGLASGGAWGVESGLGLSSCMDSFALGAEASRGARVVVIIKHGSLYSGWCNMVLRSWSSCPETTCWQTEVGPPPIPHKSQR